MFRSPYGIDWNWNRPLVVMKAVFSLLLSSISTCQYSDCKLNVLNKEALSMDSKMLCISDIGYCLAIQPSVVHTEAVTGISLGTSTMGDDHGDKEGSMMWSLSI